MRRAGRDRCKFRPMRLSALGGLAVAVAIGSGCAPTVGSECDESLARTIVYDEGGSPAYAGQAMLISSCAGGGSFCHADSPMSRYGAPYGMNFDPVLADSARFANEATGAQHLYAAQLASHHFRNSIYAQVSSGAMPPRGIGDQVMGSAYRQYAGPSDSVGTELPSLRSADGREMLRNWLACGSPVVEATTFPIATPCTSDEDCTLTHRCDTAHGECFDVGAVEPARAVTTPNWSSIYATVIGPTCALSICHGSAGAAVSGNLDLSSAAIGYTALVGIPASLGACGTRVVAGDPATSLLVSKLEGTQDIATCGSTMPVGGMLSATQIATIRTWITNGALND